MPRAIKLSLRTITREFEDIETLFADLTAPLRAAKRGVGRNPTLAGNRTSLPIAAPSSSIGPCDWVEWARGLEHGAAVSGLDETPRFFGGRSLGPMAVEYRVLKKGGIEHDESFLIAADLAAKCRVYLDRSDVQASIRDRHVIGASSAAIQGVIMPMALELGFQSEKKGLFADYDVAGLRPDYYRPMGLTGILFEVERGKTTTNNMDFLDLWKCHICDRASYLFLVVPQERPSADGSVLRHFKQVSKRLGTFFEPRN